MPFYFGKSADGSDAQEFPGYHVSPNQKYWGTEPISEEEEIRLDRHFEKRTQPKEATRSRYHK